MAGTGTFVFIGGQIATDNAGRVASVGLVPQARQALRNLRTILAEAGGAPEHIAQMTWYVLDIDHYRATLRELGLVYREIMGRHYPAMVLVEVTGLVEPAAIVEIAATAILPPGCPRPADGRLASELNLDTQNSSWLTKEARHE
jgi:enamine deaminase RidA (YjgF/YER057c/UK114 family)